MKRIKKLASLLLAVVMVLGMTMTSFAQEQQNPPLAAGQYKLALNASTNHTYKIYQVLTGTVSADGETLSDMEVGASVKSDITVKEIIEQLQDGEKSTSDNIEFLKGAALGDAALELINVDNPYEIYTRPNADESETEKDAPVLKKEFVLPGGYYVITDSFVNAEGNADTVSRTMVYLVEDVTVTPKTTSVTPDKKIKEDGTGKDSNEASIGDTITYQLSGSIPDMTGYTVFKYVLVDTASKGLIQQVNVGDILKGGIGTKNEETGLVTPDENSPVVQYEVTAVTRNADGTTTVRLAVKKAIQYANKFQENPLKWFYVDMNAQLTAEADVVTDSNTNKVKIEFSNNPNEEYDGDTDDFGPDDPKGVTPEVSVETYTTSLTLTKVDGKDENKKLSGAVFMLEGVTVNVGYVTGYEYVLKNTVSDYTGDDWYKLKDGTYTKTEPKQDGENSAYESTTDVYALVPVEIPNVSFVKKSEAPEGYTGATWYRVDDAYTQEKPDGSAEEYVLINNTPVETTAQAVTGEDGQIVFTGLGAGTYKLSEVKAPEGYNKITNKIVFTVTWSKEEGFKVVNLHEENEAGETVVTSEDTTYKISVSPENSDPTANSGKGTTLSSTIVNNNGSLLPSTGGIGTTIFYIVGGILVIGAGILLVAKKRMSSK